jgi:hypothetical protein
MRSNDGELPATRIEDAKKAAERPPLEFGLLFPRPLREGAGGWGKSLQALLPDNFQDSLNIFNYIVVSKS